jgi:hypothetical protein
MRIRFPDVLGIDERVLGSPIRQVATQHVFRDGTLVPFRRGKSQALLFTPDDGSHEVIVVPDAKHIHHDDTHMVLLSKVSAPTPDLSAGMWLRHPLKNATPDFRQEIADTIDSWRNAFAYIEEDVTKGVIGLRKPQIGAIHAVHSHWSIHKTVGTVVMPTGTGKTEVMLGVLVSAACERLVVIVPTDALFGRSSRESSSRSAFSSIPRAACSHPLHSIPSSAC